MASILDSAKLVFTDNGALTKIAILGLIPFIIYNISNGRFVISANYPLTLPVIIVLAVIYYGYLLQTLNNSLIEKTYILSALNPFLSFWIGIKGFFSNIIFVLPIYLVYWKIQPIFADYPPVSKAILTIITYIIPASFLFMSIILYSKKFNLFSGLNLIKILKNFHEIIVYLAFSLILLTSFNILTCLPFGALIYGLFGNGRLFEYCISVILTINLLLFFQNLSHAYFEQVNH